MHWEYADHSLASGAHKLDEMVETEFCIQNPRCVREKANVEESTQLLRFQREGSFRNSVKENSDRIVLSDASQRLTIGTCETSM